MKPYLFTMTTAALLFAGTASAQYTGTGTANYITKWTGATAFASSSVLYETSNRIGLGTTSPTYKLSIETAGSNDGIRINQTGSSGAALHLLNSYASNPGRLWSLYSTGSGNSQGVGNFLIFDGGTGGGVRFFIKGGNGNIAIGDPYNSNPLQKLHITGNLLIDGTTSSLFFGEGAGSSAVGEYGLEYMPGGLNFWKPWGAPTNPGGVMNYILYLNDNGNVGVNTSNPTARFTVNGKTLIGDPAAVNLSTANNYGLYVQDGVLTSKVKVATVNGSNWSDYVFAADYRLRPLAEVESFIAANRHLPEVPSACDVEDNGIDMADMSATLLKKIEELTLYTIDQQKQIDALRAELKSMKKQ